MILVAEPNPLPIMNCIHDDTEIVKGYIVARIIRNTWHDVATISGHCAAERRKDQYKEHRKDDEDHSKAGTQTTSSAKVADDARYPYDERLIL